MKNLLALLSSLVFLALALQLPGCTSKSIKTQSPQTAKSAQEVSIMTFNVENLFDDKHDAQREDFTFLPLSEKSKPEVQKFCNEQKGYYKKECLETDWNSSVIEKKLKNLSEVILSVEDHKGSDILFMTEVENENILSQLNKGYLQAAGYKTQVLIEGPDERGIDVALLSRFDLDGQPVLHKIPYKGENAEDQKWMDRSRGILEVPLKLPNGSKLIALVAHFPSQRNPRYWRAQSVEFAKKLIEERQGQMVVFGGDLNITADENDEAGFVSKQLASVGLVTHLVGCEHCDGTHNFKNDWSFLDMLVFSKNLGDNGSAPYRLETGSIDVVRYTPNHLYKGNAPKRFNEKNGEGVSDHFPVYARIIIRSPTAAQ